jgi:hypothetical protein
MNEWLTVMKVISGNQSVRQNKLKWISEWRNILFIVPGLPWNKPPAMHISPNPAGKKTELEQFHGVNLTLGNVNFFMPKRVWVKSFVTTASERKYEDICRSKRLNFVLYLGFYVQIVLSVLKTSASQRFLFCLKSLCVEAFVHVSWVCAHAQVRTGECVMVRLGAYVMWMCGSGKKK